MRHGKLNKEAFQAEMARKFRVNKGHLSVLKEERVEAPEHCECCGSGRMKNVVVITNKSKKTFRVGKTCAALIVSAQPPAPPVP